MTGQGHRLARAEPLFLIAVGGFVGATLRYVISTALPGGFPWGTLTVNVLGSFALGLLVTLPLDSRLSFVFATGFCGAFTTFSSFAFETVRLYETGRRRRAITNAVGSLGAALVGVALGAGLGSVLASTL